MSRNLETLKIRAFDEADHTDFDNLIFLWLRSFNKDRSEITDLQRRLNDELERGDLILVAEVDDRMAGWVSGRRFHDWKHGSFELVHIGVDPEFQGSKVAETLLASFENKVSLMYREKGFCLRMIWLLTHLHNKKAQRFYRRMGMKQQGVGLRGVFSEGDIQLIYSKKYIFSH